jgi:hypothetical protein
VAQIAYEVAEQFPQLQTVKTMEEYNDTRRWRGYEAALLMKKNEIRTDEEAPLTTPVDASVLEYYRASPRGSLQIAFSEASELLFRKREKAEAFFFFYKKKSLLLLLSYLFFNSKDMTLIPGVYISTLSQ